MSAIETLAARLLAEDNTIPPTRALEWATARQGVEYEHSAHYQTDFLVWQRRQQRAHAAAESAAARESQLAEARRLLRAGKPTPPPMPKPTGTPPPKGKAKADPLAGLDSFDAGRVAKFADACQIPVATARKVRDDDPAKFRAVASGPPLRCRIFYGQFVRSRP